MQILLGSGGLNTERRLQIWKEAVDQFVGDANEVLFVPYAFHDHDLYVSRIRERGLLGTRKIQGIHQFKDKKAAIQDARVIFVGGGNTFRLLNQLWVNGLIEVIRSQVRAEKLLYMGISAGSNVAGPTIMTTNDMPIVQPPTFQALGFLPVQLNPHYTRGAFHYVPAGKTELEPYGGETRDDRLNEFHEDNTRPILALDEGAVLRASHRDGKWKTQIIGEMGGRYFQRGIPPVELKAGPSDFLNAQFEAQR